jgi:AraC-like DNA-binding protein
MALSGFVETAKELDLATDEILYSHGLNANYFDRIGIDEMMDFELAIGLIESVAKESGQHHCGVLMGSKQDIHFLGIIGYLMEQSKDVLDALNALSQHLSIHTPTPVTIEDYGQLTSINFINILPLSRQSYSNEMAMAQAMVIMKTLCGNQFKPKSVHFNHARKSDSTIYERIFRAPVHFEQSKTELIFDSELNNQPILRADPLLKQILTRQIEQIKTDESMDIRSQVEPLIRRSLQSQRYQIDRVAKHLSLHPRTLQRKLKDAGMNYSKIVEDIRKDVATERLKNSNITIMQLSDYLGYNDNTAFTRAFKKWFGETPVQWRKKQK